MHPIGEPLGLCPQFVVKPDLGSSPVLTVEERTALNHNAEHLFETERLRAELNLVAGIHLRPSAFVLDRKGPPPTLAIRQLDCPSARCFNGVELHHICLAGQSQSQGLNVQAARNNHARPHFCPYLMHSIVENSPLCGEPVLFPLLFKMDQPPLPRAKLQMLQS
jgi:hypothetical protein